MHPLWFRQVLLALLIRQVYSLPDPLPASQPKGNAAAPTPASHHEAAFKAGPIAPGTTQHVSRSFDGEDLEADVSVTTIAAYRNLRAQMAVISDDPNVRPMVIYPRGIGLVFGAIVAVGSITIAEIQYLANGGPKFVDVPMDDPQCKPIQCSACGGNTLAICTTGRSRNCPCIPKQKCPVRVLPSCINKDCKGDASNKCTLGPQKGCKCRDRQYKVFRDPFNLAWFPAQQQFLGSNPSTGPPRGHPSSNPTCSTNNGLQIPVAVLDGTGARRTLQSLFYSMRETLCNNKCEAPATIPAKNMAATPDGSGCEIAIALQAGTEVYAYRGTASTGAQWQDCWDSFASITERCIQDRPDTGWVNGPDVYEFFQAGYRPVNDPSSKHVAKGVRLGNVLQSSILYCSQCGSSPKYFGTCNSGPNVGTICCGDGVQRCSDSRCKGVGAFCTGGARGCLCTFNGR